MHDINTIPETVRVTSEVSEDNPLGYIVINKVDFDEKEHKLFEEKKVAQKAEAPAITPAWQQKQ
jgi:hypothetical protein